jgi:hypothetical protein
LGGVVGVPVVSTVALALVSTMLCVFDVMRVPDVLSMNRVPGGSVAMVVVGHGSPPGGHPQCIPLRGIREATTSSGASTQLHLRDFKH